MTSANAVRGAGTPAARKTEYASASRAFDGSSGIACSWTADSPLNLLVAELVERDLQRPLQAARGDEVGDVAGVANADLLQGLAVRGEVCLGPREVGAEEVPLHFPVPRRGSGTCGSTQWLHGIEFTGRDDKVDRPHLGLTKHSFAFIRRRLPGCV